MCHAVTINALLLLCAVLFCRAHNKSCEALSSLGKVVEIGANFSIFCILEDGCKEGKILMFRDTVEEISFQKVNSTTSVHEVEDLRTNQTFTCKCAHTHGSKMSQFCGIDITVGYYPEVPQNLICEQDGEFGNVTCTCETGKESGLWTTAVFHVATTSLKSKVPVLHLGRSSAVFDPGQETQLTVTMRNVNKLGESRAREINISLPQIVKPRAPVLAKADCSSHLCHLLLTNVSSSGWLQVRYKPSKGQWATQFLNRTNSNHQWSVLVAVEPFMLYDFQARVKPGPDKGRWSNWSPSCQCRTGEDAPIKMLDTWYFKESPESYILLWKTLNQTEARGKILGYKLSLENTKGKNLTVQNVINTTFASVTCPMCSQCVVHISAFNSRGNSPPAHMPILCDKENPSIESSVSQRNGSSIALSWRLTKPTEGEAVTSYVVEWIGNGKFNKDLQWRRLHPSQHSINITGLQEHKCYTATVYALLQDGQSRSRLEFSPLPKVPVQGPDVTNIKAIGDVEGSVEVTWKQIPADHWRGCPRNYTVYVQESQGRTSRYDVEYVHDTITIPGFRLGRKYQFFMTAWTDAGESPAGQMRDFKIKNNSSTFVPEMLVVCSSIVFPLLSLLCLCHVFSLPQRFLTCFRLHPGIVPDPANSKWAKEFSGDEGNMRLNLYLSDSSVSEEPDTIEVQEVSGGLTPSDLLADLDTFSSNSITETSPAPPSSLTCPSSTYLKSFSQESDQTQTSQNTDVTVDYISTHGMSEETEEVDEEEPFHPCPLFDPSISIGGKLTLDAVKIDCSGLLEEPFFLHC